MWSLLVEFLITGLVILGIMHHSMWYINPDIGIKYHNDTFTLYSETFLPKSFKKVEVKIRNKS